MRDDVSIETLRDRLSCAAVSYDLERRGYGNRRGVPDSVIWLGAKNTPFRRLVPILIELEGNFNNAIDDFEKFSHREDKDYPNHVRWPIIGIEEPASINLPLRYDIRSITSLTATAQRHAKEADLHRTVQQWVRNCDDYINTSAFIRRYENTGVIWWQLDITLIGGHKYKVKTPIIFDPGENLQEIIESRFNYPTLPSLVVVNGRASGHRIEQYNTQVKFLRVVPASLKNPDYQ